MYKLSMFSVFVDLTNDSFIARNYFSGAAMLINEHVKEGLQSLPSDNPFEQNEDWQKIVGLLLAEGIIVLEEEDEEKKFREFLDGIQKDVAHLTIYLATTTRCNLRCTYCYEKDLESFRMVDQVGQDFLSWLNQRLSSGEVKFVVLSLYGGEPLVDFRRLEGLVPLVSGFCKETGAELLLSLVTNGTLLDQEKVDFLLKYGLVEVQVTIDGPQEVHDSRRVGKGNQPTFSTIVGNLTNVVGKVERIIIRINFDLDTYPRIPELLDMLAEFGYRDKVTLSFHKTNWDIATAENYKQPLDSICPEGILESREVGEAYIFLCREAKKRGFAIPEAIDMGPCMTIEKNSAVIDPKGRMYKCVEMIARDGFEVGSLAMGFDERRLLGYLEAKYLDFCFEKKCPLIPICVGGCRSRAFLSSGSQFNPDCQRRLLEEINSELVKLQFVEEIG